MLTKEQIREKHLEKNCLLVSNSSVGKLIQKSAFGAMEEYARQVAIDFFDWQKKDYAECNADMSTEEWFDKYLEQNK